MKRTVIMILMAAMLITAFSGFMAIENKPLELIDCRLTQNDAHLQILPGSRYRADSVSLTVQIEDEKQQHIADGFKIIELLHIPVTGISFRVPLSKRLSSETGYKVSVKVETRDSEASGKQWSAVKVSGTCS
ncbi:MAG: hypothetical protein PHD82_17640, partial [Candidatus Riflebacteria bacterium]|nr:hypothetical protein [Candidatus Riflebacteria bacterium]